MLRTTADGKRECRVDGCSCLFVPKQDGAGTWRCTAHTIGRLCCARCGRVGRGPAERHGEWPYVCAPCLYPLSKVRRQLRTHRVSWAMVAALLADPRCPGCSVNMLGDRPCVSVDHDHRCCPGIYSCGPCVRGLICSRCNTALGMMRDDADNIERLAAYLRGAQR